MSDMKTKVEHQYDMENDQFLVCAAVQYGDMAWASCELPYPVGAEEGEKQLMEASALRLARNEAKRLCQQQ